MKDRPALVMGVVALVASGLYFADLSGTVEVDEVVAAVTLWVALAGVLLVRSAVRLRQRLSG
ncbi:MAG: hypothetical protein JWO22_2624 [Frankiales bacterium]|nr:hypothetical protein [Frankiales bacterium]